MAVALKSKVPEVSSLILFVISALFATFLSSLIIESGAQTPPTSGTQGAYYIIYYLVAAIAFSAVVIYLGRKRIASILRWVFLAIIAYIVFYVWIFIGAYIAQTYLEYYIMLFAAPAIIVLLLIFKNEWYVVDAAGFFLVVGVSAIWSLIIGVWASVVFLVVFAIYDYIAVYRTKHMVSLAKVAVNEKLPLLFVFPGEKGVKMKDVKMADGVDKGEHKMLLLGFGDMVFPSIMVVASYLYGKANPVPFLLFPLIGAIIGMGVLLFTKVARPAPGLPLINGGAVSGFLIAYLVFTVLL